LNDTVNDTVNVDNESEAKKQTEYQVLEIGEVDANSEGNHVNEVSLIPEIIKKDTIDSKKTINYNDVDYEAEYDMTSIGYYYQNERDIYQYKSGETITKFGINCVTNKIDSYSFVRLNFKNDITEAEISRDECLEIAQKYLAQYIEITNYELIDERYYPATPTDIPYYNFEFRRVSDGVRTSDCAYIEVSAFGDVESHLFISLGEMKGAKLPSKEDMQTIQVKVDEKLKAIYKDASEKYEVTYDNLSPLFVRLADGRYAFEYSISVTLRQHDNPEFGYSELTKLLVYLD
jgi:hypothetical protein